MFAHDQLVALAQEVREFPSKYEMHVPKLLEAYAGRLEDAQFLVFEESAVEALYDISRSDVGMDPRLVPFDRVYTEISLPGSGDPIAAVAEKDDGGLKIRCFSARGVDRVTLDGCVTHFPVDGPQQTSLEFPEALSEYGRQNPDHVNDRIEVAAGLAKHVFQILFTFSALRREDGVLEEEPEQLYSRQQRRRAKREGRPLTNRSVTRISLGEVGRQHRAAMEDDTSSGSRRAHWVRGHLFLARNGKITWRRPHVRGTGSLQKTVRVIERGSQSLAEDTTRLSTPEDDYEATAPEGP